MAACIARDLRTIRILIKAGARVNKADEVFFRTVATGCLLASFSVVQNFPC